MLELVIADGPSLGAVIRRGCRAAREAAGDPLGRVAVVCPSRTSGEQIMRAMAGGGGLFNVSFLTPGEIVAAIGRPLMEAAGLRPEPPGWLDGLLSAALPTTDLGPHQDVLQQPGWRAPLAAALRELEAAGATDEDLAVAAAADPAMAARCQILAALQARVAAARRRERRHTQRALEQAALDHLRAGRPHRHDDVIAALVVSDTMLSPLTQAALSAWLSGRQVARLALPPTSTLPSAPGGLWEAAAPAPVAHILTPPTALGHLQQRAFLPPSQPAPPDDTVVLAATPDEVREVEAAVREVMQAVRQGTPLDQIAIVLPDPAQADVLEEALERAGLAAAWLTAAPLRRTLPARFLTLALQVAAGDSPPDRWHQLLTRPGLIGLGRSGRLRWRRLLAGVPAGTAQDSLPAIQAHLAVVAEDEEASEHQRAAAATLSDNITLLSSTLAALPRSGTLSEHGAAWSKLLRDFHAPGRERARVVRLLEGLGDGARLSLSAAAGLLGDLLEGTPNLRGSLSQRVVRVLPPMLVLGGSYQLVCVTGLSDGRFPRTIRDGGILSEDLRALLLARGVPLVTRAEREAVERRRLAAILSGCRGRLWLSSPRTELLEGRPRLPGALMLQLGSALAGERLSLSALHAGMVPCGQRSAPAPAVADAVGAREHRLARASHDAAASLDDLLCHPGIRRLAALHRAVDQLLYEEGPPTEWTGLVDPDTLSTPALSGEAMSAGALTSLVFEPSDYFLSELLGARGARRLRSQAGLSEGDLRREVLRQLDGADTPEDFAAAWQGQVAKWAAQAGLDADTQTVLLLRGQRHFDTLDRAGAAAVQAAAPVEGAALPGGFQVAVPDARLLGDALLERRSYASKNTIKADADSFRLLAEGYALEADGQPVEAVRRIGLNGADRAERLDRLRAPFAEAAEAGAARAAAGWWPVLGGKARLALARERADGPRLDPQAALARLDREEP